MAVSRIVRSLWRGMILVVSTAVLIASCAGEADEYQPLEATRTIEYQWQREGYLPPGAAFDEDTLRCIDEAAADLTADDFGASGIEVASPAFRAFAAVRFDECLSDDIVERYFRVDMVAYGGMTEDAAGCMAPRFLELVRDLGYEAAMLDRSANTALTVEQIRADCGADV